MTDQWPAPPLAVDVVPAHEFDELIARAQKDLSRLEREHTIAEAAAIAAERNVSDVPDDPELSDWAEAQLDRFVEGLRAEHEVEMQAALEAARDRAATCIEHADLEADLVLSYARATVDARGAASPNATSALSGPGAPVVWRVDADAPSASALVAPEPLAPAAAERVLAPAPVPPQPTIAPDAPAVVAPVVAPEDGASPWAPVSSPWAELAGDEQHPGSVGDGAGEPPAENAVLVSTSGSDGGGATAEPDREFWKEPENEAPKRTFLKRLPMFAILQVVGVVIVLIVVLLRIG